jgi:predicted dehydrogenase
MNPHYRVCLVGCGGMGRAHSQCLMDGGRCKIVSTVDIDESRAREYQAELNATRWATDYRRELARDDVDIVLVTTLPSQHAEIAVAALQADKHVICEKPIAHNLSDARRVLAAAEKSAGRILISLQLRCAEPWPTIVRKLRGGLIGHPLVLRMAANQINAGHMARKSLEKMIDTSPIIDCGVHYVDLMCAMTNCRPVLVSAQGANIHPALPDPHYNYGLLQVRFEDGSLGYYEAGWGPMVSKNAWYIKDFWGPKGSYGIVYELDRDVPEGTPTEVTYRLQHRSFPHVDCEWSDMTFDEEIIRKKVGKGNSLRPMHDAFLDGIETGNEDFLEPLRAAYDAQRIVMAADRSIREKRFVSMDEEL